MLVINKVEAKWLFYRGDGIISEMIRKSKKNEINIMLVANTVIYQNVCDITLILWELSKEGYEFLKEDIVMLSLYLTRHIKRFGEHMIDLENVPQPIEGIIQCSL
ncbi:Tn3 family transposase [Neobacillus drentensis]|uniref:Tn3 family transposase n=1 Tax=Neobacillus drentensis TaxID=220684 RepID=UPI003000284F